MGLGTTELLIVLVIALIIFGGRGLPKLARSLGEARRELIDGARAGEPDVRSSSADS